MADDELAPVRGELGRTPSAQASPRDIAEMEQELDTLAAQAGVRVEFEISYDQDAPPAGAFAFHVTYVDREVRRVAKAIRDGRTEEPFWARSRMRPLRIRSGLKPREGGPGSFLFLLDVPKEIYDFILSDPVDFAIRLFELTQLYVIASSHFARIRRGAQATELPLPVPEHEEDDLAQEEEQDEEAEQDEAEEEAEPEEQQSDYMDLAQEPPPAFAQRMPPEIASSASSYEITQRIIAPDGTTFEFTERVEN